MVTRDNTTDRSIDAWRTSRSGAWAGRGFHYQHLISTLILIRQWIGHIPSGFLVPEGLEDCVIEVANQECWLQIKSRQEGSFSKGKVENILSDLETKASASSHSTIRYGVVLEQPCTGMGEVDIDGIFKEPFHQVYVCQSPGEQCVGLLTDKLNVVEAIAEGLVNDLYRLVAEVSQENASLSFEHRRKISTTEIERLIFERLETVDAGAMGRALVEGALEPVDFSKPVSDPAFYHGVKAKPGHVAAGLVIHRPDDTLAVTNALKNRRQVLLCGQSGAGKSALLWLSVNALAGEIRWYQISVRALAADADAIIKFVRARRPSSRLPLGLAMDELGPRNSDLWDILTRELRAYPGVYLIGSVRQEDVSLVTNQADAEIIPVSLNEKLAESVWHRLRADEQTSWEHWQEPFEKSDGLMLEYVHLLTQGKRLFAVIEEQIRLREEEKRDDELAIIRSASTLFSFGGEVRTHKLCSILEIAPANASRALTRLIDEHLIKESRPGVLSGLHALRSQALSRASHDELVYLADLSLWQGLAAITHDSMPGVIQSLLNNCSVDREEVVLRKLAEILTSKEDVEAWVAILTGLGLATLERCVIAFMKILEQHGVQRAQWALAAMFGCDAQIDIPELSEFEQWQNLREAIFAFRAIPKQDLRKSCMDYISGDCVIPTSQELEQANRLFSCLVPIAGGEPVPINVTPDVIDKEEHDIQKVAALLSTAYLIDSALAKQLTQTFGGEQTLFTWFRSQTPWVTMPTINPEGEHGRTIRSDCYLVAEQEQPDPHETVCSICETLIALSPDSDAAASDVLNPLDKPWEISGHRPWSKNMPRENIPSKARVAWNVAFRQIMLARSVSISLTDYTQQMAELVRRTEKVLRSFTEKWIRGKKIINADALADEVNSIIHAVNALAYATPAKPASVMVNPVKGGDGDDSLGALLTGVLGNLIRRLGSNSDAGGTKGAAIFAGSLAEQAREHRESDIWRTHMTPPLNELKAIESRLNDISCILHEMAYDDDHTSIQKLIASTRKGTPGKAIVSAARRCRMLAEQRMTKRLRILDKKLKNMGWNTKCWVRSLDERDSVYWPAKEVAITVEINDFESDAAYSEECLDLGQRTLGSDWNFRVVPVINGVVLAPMALMPSSSVPMPDLEFADEWVGHITLPFCSHEMVAVFDAALAACMQLSGIIACRDLDALHPDEHQVFSKAIDNFRRNQETFSALAKKENSEYIEWALDYLNETWDQVVEEFEARKSGRSIGKPLCVNPHLALAGEANEESIEIGVVRMLMLQEECLRAAENLQR